MDNFSKFVLGTSGIGGIELTQNVDFSAISQGGDFLGTLMQVVIGVVTLIGFFRKKQRV